jgi:Family of unknown function (DUF5652)
MWSKRKLPRWARTVLALVAVWDAVWKGMALWQAAKRRQPGWFIALLVVNSAGIFPIVYIWMMRRRDAAAALEPQDQ